MWDFDRLDDGTNDYSRLRFYGVFIRISYFVLVANVFASTKGLSLRLDVLGGESFIRFLRFKFRGLRKIEKGEMYIEVAMLMGTTIAERNVFIVQRLDPICILICKTNALRNTNIDIDIYANPFIGHASSLLGGFF